MNFDIKILSNCDFIDDLDGDQNYFGEQLKKFQIKVRLESILENNGLIFLVKKNNQITCFFTYRHMKSFPSWSLSNLFIVDHSHFSPNMLGFGYAMDMAVEYGEKNNLFTFFWVCEKSLFNQRYSIGMRDLKRRNSILQNYTFHIVQDSDVHKGYEVCDFLTGKSNLPTYIVMASKNIPLP